MLPLPAVRPSARSTTRRRCVVVSVALALAGLAGAAFLFGGGAARAERLRARFAGAAPRAVGQVLRRRAYDALIGRPLYWISDRVFLRLRRPRAARRLAARPGRARRGAPPACSAACRPATCTVCAARARRASSAALAWSWRMSDAALLNLVLFLPLLGIALLVALPARRDDLVRGLSLAVMVVQFVLDRLALHPLRSARRRPAVRDAAAWIADWGVNYQIGLDGYNVLLVLLTAFLGPLVVAGAFTAITKDVKLFYAMVFADPVRDAGHVPRAGPVPVLPVLGSDADPDVPASSASGAASGASTRRSSSCSTRRSAAS